MKSKIGLIGFGRLGKIILKELKKDFRVLVHDIHNKSKDIKMSGGGPVYLNQIYQCPIIVLSVPIFQLRNLLTQMAPNLKPGTILIDTCSVKEYPARVMKQFLPEHVQLLGTHPMFGPDSYQHTLKKQQIVLCPIRIRPFNLRSINRYLRYRGMKVLETSAMDHDRQTAESLILPQFIGAALQGLHFERRDIKSMHLDRLNSLKRVSENDGDQLLKDMTKYNRFSRTVRDRFIKNIVKINQDLLY